MPVTVLVGAQWGDEGKGRYVDFLASQADVVARYGGGDNAGHTVAVADAVYKMHLIPSGVLHEGVVSILGNGMVINPVKLLREMDRLLQMGVRITPENLLISTQAHVITAAHIEFDRASEAARGKDAIGTTLRGIGPAYTDKIQRQGLRWAEILDIEGFADQLEAKLNAANIALATEGHPQINVQASVGEYLDAAKRLRPFIADTVLYLNQRLREGAQAICEGAQGTLLDIDHGSYPFVTSSSPSVGGALTGLGVGPQQINRVIGVTKAFNTRVGAGPMPTELHDEIADRLRGTGENFWDEYGTTTGRKRRCGWLDAVLLRYTALVNGFTELALTKLDILSGFDELKIAVAYELDGQTLDFPPSTIPQMSRVQPIYETLAGWHEDITGARSLDDLPTNAQRYIQRIAEVVGVPVHNASVGPERQQLVTLSA